MHSDMPGLKLGTTQLLGHFVVDSSAQYTAAISPGVIERALRGTRYGAPLAELLADVRAKLGSRR